MSKLDDSSFNNAINESNIHKDYFLKFMDKSKRGKFLPASVFLPFWMDRNNEPHILFTQRSRHLKSHPGQIGFPGGVQEANESLLDTALREWEEEMGKSAGEIEILGRYYDLLTVTGYRISTFVGIFKGDLNFSFSEEVESAFAIPFSQFWYRDFYCIDFSSGGRTRVYYLDLGDHGLLWGATCEILVNFLKDTQGFTREPRLVHPNLPGPPFLQLPLI